MEPKYKVIEIQDKGKYGAVRVSKDVIFDLPEDIVQQMDAIPATPVAPIVASVHPDVDTLCLVILGIQGSLRPDSRYGSKFRIMYLSLLFIVVST